MRKTHHLRAAAGAALLWGGMGFFSGHSAFAGDGCGPAPALQPCEPVFQESGEQLRRELQVLAQECCQAQQAAPPAEVDCCEGRLMRLFEDCEGNNWLSSAGFSLGGWLEQGITFSDAETDLGPFGFNDRANEYALNQFYLILAKDAAVNPDQWGWGMQMDLLVGTDANNTVAAGWDDSWVGHDGNEDYGIAMPQLYASFYAPVGNGLTVKVGHFYTIIGYEVVTAPDNFFYSHALTMQFSEPFTHTGAIASYNLNDNIALSSGIQTGWDDFENENESWGYIGGISWASDDGDTSLAFAVVTGDETDVRGGGLESNRTMYSIVFSQALSEKMTYVLQHDYGTQDNAVVTGTDSEWYGINQYLFYALTEDLKAGLRAEWYRDADGFRLGVDNANYYNVTGGLNWSITDCLLLRPELRWDWSDEPGTFDGGTGDELWTMSTDLILTF